MYPPGEEEKVKASPGLIYQPGPGRVIIGTYVCLRT